MSTTDRQAFPRPNIDGMTLREWYAGMAMQGIVASRSRPIAEIEAFQIAKLSKRIAAEMIKADDAQET